MFRELVRPIEYRVELLSVVAREVVSRDETLLILEHDEYRQAVVASDGYNQGRLTAIPGNRLVGIGWVVEYVQPEWFVAWRPFSPAPELVPLKD